MKTDICDEIDDARECGVVHCYIIEIQPIPLAELAPQFNLFFTPDIYKEIRRDQAEKVARRILHRDLAYDVEIMPEKVAQDLASRFLDCFEKETSQYYTNGSYYCDSMSWNPATDATFDTGILVISQSCSGCLWVEDED
jgi:hypothetical protein